MDKKIAELQETKKTLENTIDKYSKEAEELEEKKPEIIADLKAALAVYKDFGVYSTMIEYTATFEF